MNKVQMDLVKILNTAIHGNKINFDINKKINWESIIEEAKAHNVEALIYSAIDKETLNTIDNNLLEPFKKKTFMSGVWQINHVNKISNVFSEFNKANIDVVALKGLVVRDLYPKKELRTMGDADILVHRDDLDIASDLLLSLGFENTHSSEKHTNFEKDNLEIELHCNIEIEKKFEGINEFESELWKDIVKVKVGNAEVLSLSDENLALHLCIHMAGHIKYGGFGIRQLCDLVLLVEQRGSNIDWNSFYNKSKKYSAYKFTVVIFMLCNKLFDMKVPSILNNVDVVSSGYLDVLLDDIFASGVHGKRDTLTMMAKGCAKLDDEYESSIFKNYIKMFFPNCEGLGERYEYAKNNNILLPIAWIHRLFVGVFKKDCSIKDKTKFAVCGMSISKKRSDLLNWLEL